MSISESSPITDALRAQLEQLAELPPGLAARLVELIEQSSE